MFLDYRSADADADIRCDICIIGAGAAGITLARALDGSGIAVCLIESGGLDFSTKVQALYEGESVGMENANPMECRLRYFGGTTNHWAGLCAPLQPSDFALRPWVSGSGWPLARDELLPWYAQASRVCELGAPGLECDEVSNPAQDFPDFQPERFVVRQFRYSPPTRFGNVYRKSLADAPDVRVLLHANVLTLETNETASEVRAAHIRTREGKQGLVRARIFVLASGGMENVRLLLLSNRVRPEGLGNESGLVGRYFMQHLEGRVANMLANDPQTLAGYFDRYEVRDALVRSELALSDLAQAQAGILSSGFTIDARAVRGEGYMALRKVWKAFGRGEWPDDFSQKMRTVMGDLGSLGDAFLGNDDYGVTVWARAETQPNPESRISLGKTRDPFGLPRVRVNWQLTPFDRSSLSESLRLLGAEFGRLGLGRLEVADWLLPDSRVWPQPIWGGCHHMGTIRMSERPDSGVVDRDCRMHGVGNLYVSGSAVFPSGGHVPPTLTVVALALRLADHLQRQFATA